MRRRRDPSPPPIIPLPRVRARAHSAFDKGGGDQALASLDEIARSPLGHVWLRTDTLDRRVDLPSAERPRQGVVAALPRRKLIEGGSGSSGMPAMSRDLDFRASKLAAFARMFVWLWGGLRYVFGNFWDWARGRASIRARGVRMRETLESLGPTFIKVGQQLAVRADMLPYEYCEELAKMFDSVPPFPTPLAIEAVERVTEQPIGQTFAVFDPDPVGSASLACVYQALLHDGDKVAVKVRRPGIAKTLAADLKAIDWIMRIAELFILVRPGTTKNLRYELHTMLKEEVDFYREARYTDLFRQQAAAAKQSFVTAPRVYFELSGEDVLVTEFVPGVSVSELLTATDKDDAETLGQLAARGIDPKIVAQRLVAAFNWECLDNHLFNADPHPANIIVQPGNSIVFIDFGACGRSTSKHKRSWRQFHRHLANEDVYGMVEVAISMMEPLPPIDLDSFTKEAEALYWDWLIAMKSADSQWWEKASGVMWIKFMGLCRRYGVPASLDTLRAMRVTLLFDTIVFRLWKDLDLSAEAKKFYLRKGDRAGKRFKKAVRKMFTDGPTGTEYLVAEDMAGMQNQIAGRLQHILDTPQPKYGVHIDKAAYGVTVALQLMAVGLGLHVLLVLSFHLYAVATGSALSFWDVFVAGLTHPLFHTVPLVVVILLIRKLLIRLSDVDVHD